MRKKNGDDDYREKKMDQSVDHNRKDFQSPSYTLVIIYICVKRFFSNGKIETGIPTHRHIKQCVCVIER